MTGLTGPTDLTDLTDLADLTDLTDLTDLIDLTDLTVLTDLTLKALAKHQIWMIFLSTCHPRMSILWMHRVSAFPTALPVPLLGRRGARIRQLIATRAVTTSLKALAKHQMDGRSEPTFGSPPPAIRGSCSSDSDFELDDAWML